MKVVVFVQRYEGPPVRRFFLIGDEAGCYVRLPVASAADGLRLLDLPPSAQLVAAFVAAVPLELSPLESAHFAAASRDWAQPVPRAWVRAFSAALRARALH